MLLPFLVAVAVLMPVHLSPEPQVNAERAPLLRGRPWPSPGVMRGD